MSKNRSKIERWFSSELFAAILIIIGLLIFALAVILFFTSGFFEWFGNIDPEVSGQLGDLVGGVVGAIWALAGVILFYRALVREKVTTSQIQFNNTFFHLFNLYCNRINSMTVEVRSETGHLDKKIGIDCFEYYYDVLKERWEIESNKEGLEEEFAISNAVRTLVGKHSNNLIHYIGTVESLLRYLITNRDDAQEVHLSLLQGSISSFERSFLFYYAASTKCTPEMRMLIVDSRIIADTTSFKRLSPKHSSLWLKNLYPNKPKKGKT